MFKPLFSFRQASRVNLLAKMLGTFRSLESLQHDASVCTKALALKGRNFSQGTDQKFYPRQQRIPNMRKTPLFQRSVSSHRPVHRLSRGRFFVYTLFCSVLLGSMFLVSDAFAHNGDLFREEIGKVEKLFTGGYMRLGLLGVCGLTAIMGAVQQNAWMFLSGILAGVFAFFMKDWILATFAYVI